MNQPSSPQGISARFGLGVILALTVSVLGPAACTNEPPSSAAIPCDDSRDCPGGQFCGCGGYCVTPTGCEQDNDCCANELCEDGLCLERFDCYSDSECSDGSICQGCACLPPACDTNQDCGGDRLCDAGACLSASAHPCLGDCTEAQACDPLSDICIDLPAACEDVQCEIGQTLLLDGVDERIGPGCYLNPPCICSQTRDPPVGAMGTEFSAVLIGQTRFGILAHDHTYGDLVYLEADQNGELTEPRYIDGIPDEPARGDPTGNRQGIYGEGPERGSMPSAASLNGQLGVTYHDETNLELRFARQVADTLWESSVVDNLGETGPHSSLLGLSQGQWAVAYFARQLEESHLRLAVSNNSAPFGPSDWSFTIVDSGPYQSTLTPELPIATGLFPAMAEHNSQLFISYYDRDQKELRLAYGSIGGSFSVLTVDTGQTRSEMPDSGDVGLFSAIAFTSSGTVALTYLDQISGQIWYAELDLTVEEGDVFVVGPEEVDPGRQTTPPALVGPGLMLAFDPAGRAVVAYQDTTEGDLVIAYRGNDAWEQTRAFNVGVGGFSPHIFPNHSEGIWALHGVLTEEPRTIAEGIDVRLVPHL